MPIYSYRCESCGHAKDVLQKVSDPLLTVCPACGAATFKKQLTAAGFQLKGSGWYVTDFKGDGKPAKTPADAAKPDAAAAAGATGEAAKAAPDKSAAPAAAPAAEKAAPAPAPAPAPGGSGTPSSGQ